MEATDCRRAFPCWDEPDFKAVVRRDAGRRRRPAAPSPTGPRSSATPRADGGRVRVRFADTMPMSTYLVAFVVGPARGDARPSTWTACRCASSTSPARAISPAFALEIGAFALRWFQDYYGIPYPGDEGRPRRAAGLRRSARWRTSGCITFRETALLVDPATAHAAGAPAHRRRRRPRAGPHVVRRPRHDEVVERHLAQRGVRHVHGGGRVRRLPSRVEALDELRPRAHRGVRGRLAGTAPARSSTRSCRRPTPRACSTCSPTRRAARCCACWSSTSATERFRDGIRHYLTTHAYGNTETSDLWDAIEAATGEPVRRDDGLLDLAGRVTRSSAPSRSADGRNLVLAQRRFLFSGDDDGTRWIIPVHIRQTAR